MKIFIPDLTEKSILVVRVQYAQAILEGKQSKLNHEGKPNKEIDDMVMTLEMTLEYIHQIYNYSEAQNRLTNDQDIELRKLKKENKILQEQIEFESTN